MVPTKYLEAVRGILEHLENTQLSNVEKAADIVADSLANGGAVFCHDIGHGIQGDFINRAGGLAAVQPLSFNFGVRSPVAKCLNDRPKSEPFEQDLETVRFAIKAGNLRKGDVVMLGSVSGKNRIPVELATACREYGVRVIGLTSLKYSTQVESLHPSGKRLFEVVDVAIDIGVPYGDAGVDIPGYDFKVIPLSGIAMDAAGWMVWGRVMEKMAADGNPPSVFMSVNREGGWEHYEKAQAEYNERGY